MKLRAIQVVTGLMAVGCWDPGLPSTGQAEPAVASAQARFLTVEPAASDGVRPLSRFGFELPAGGALESLRLYQGALSDYHQRRISKGELPNTLLEREVPVIRWAANTADAGSVQRVMSQAQVPLDPGESYTWAWLGQGPLLSFAVGDEQPMGWRRLWPTVDAGFWGYAAYCQESSGVVRDAGSGVLQPAAGASALNWVFEPGAHPATARQGLGLLDIAQDACLHFEIDSDPLPELLVPPLAIAGSTLDPAPLRAQRSDPVQPLRCEDDWRPMGPGCIQVQDDRLAIASPSSPTLWLLGSSDLQFYGVQQGPFVVRGLAPGHEHIFEFTTHSVDGRRHQGRMALTTAPARSHVIINEVLANPQGAEPAQEWVELYNDGTGASELGDWTLSDGTGQSVLPAVVLRPGEYLIVTSEQYVPGGEDVPFAEGVVVVRVSSLGANGLGNSGEALQLISASGQVQSRFVARAASTGGVSIARVTPAAPDGAEASFARHGEPGASPGAPNIF